jgi:hypothetical protein
MGSIALAAACALPASAASEFKDVAMRCAASAKGSKLIAYTADLVLDDAGRAFTVRADKPERRVTTVPYDDILKIVVESVTSAPPVRGATAPQRHYWFYFERKPGAYPERFVLDVGKDSADLLTKARQIFGDRLRELEFPRAEDLADLASLTDLSSNYSVRVRRPSPPMPAIPIDRALIVVICPELEGAKKRPINLDANGRVVASNQPGTYSFVYLDPGEYTVVSQAENARWLRVKLEAGKAYYFFQDPLDAGDETGLSMHSKEMAMFEIAGASYSDWRRERY